MVNAAVRGRAEKWGARFASPRHKAEMKSHIRLDGRGERELTATAVQLIKAQRGKNPPSSSSSSSSTFVPRAEAAFAWKSWVGSKRSSVLPLSLSLNLSYLPLFNATSCSVNHRARRFLGPVLAFLGAARLCRIGEKLLITARRLS